MTTGKLAALIRESMREQFIKESPSKKCFDYSEANMERLSLLINDRSTAEDAQEVRGHLRECPRCRFVYACVREKGK
jgi:hypothetical protein